MPYNYYNAYNPYMPNGYMPYMQNNQRIQEPYQQVQQGQLNQPNQPMPFNRQTNLQGKIVTNIEEVKAIDIPLDFTSSYFPLADGSAIVTKQLQQDGTSKILVYKPVDVEEKADDVKYITEEDLKAQFGDLSPRDIRDMKEEIKSLKKRLRELTDDMEDKKGV